MSYRADWGVVEAVAMMGWMVFYKGDVNSQGEGNIKQKRDTGPDIATAVPWH